MNNKYIDLTHPLTSQVPTWNGSCGFHVDIKKDYDREFRVQQIKMHAGIGTHMDAPSHRFQGAPSIADIPLESCIVPAICMDVSNKAHADYEVTLDDIHEFESAYGSIMAGTLVIVHTGWWRFWGEPTKYRNEDAHKKMHFPAVSHAAAEKLLARGIVGLAIDTLSPDCRDTTFPVHQILLGSGKYIIENVSDPTKLPPCGGSVIALPIRAVDCTEAPIRLVGVILD